MVKTPKMRHSKGRREPVTIELGPGEVSRVEDKAPETGPDLESKSDATAAASRPESAASSASAASAATAASAEAKAERPAASRFTGSDYSFQEGGSRSSANPGGAAAASSASARKEPPPSPGPGQAGRGLGALPAAVFGGVIALAGAGALQFAGLLGVPGNASGGQSLDAVNGEIASLRGEVESLRQAAGDGADTRLDGLAGELDRVKADLAALKTSVDSGSSGAGAATSELSARLQDLEKTVAALGGAAPVDLGPVNEKIAALEALVKSSGDAASAREDRLAALEQSVTQLSAKVEAQAAQPRIALAIAAAALKSAVERGTPFAAELDTLAAITPDAPQIAALRPYAAQGVPARAAIAADMDAAANAMIAAARPVDENAGFFDRLLASAESLVKVRPIGAVEGAGAPETVARMEVAVTQGDYGKALAEYDTLPEPSKAAGADFAGKLKARLEVEEQVDALISGAMKS